MLTFWKDGVGPRAKAIGWSAKCVKCGTESAVIKAGLGEAVRELRASGWVVETAGMASIGTCPACVTK